MRSARSSIVVMPIGETRNQCTTIPATGGEPDSTGALIGEIRYQSHDYPRDKYRHQTSSWNRHD
jgi:hypothetical protein